MLMGFMRCIWYARVRDKGVLSRPTTLICVLLQWFYWGDGDAYDAV